MIYCQSSQSRLMRKPDLKMPSPIPPFFLGSTSSPLFLPPPSTSKQGMGVGVSSSHCCCPSPQGKDSSCSSPAAVWGPSQGRQPSTNFNMGPSHRLQFFMSCCSMGCSPSGDEFQGMHRRASVSVFSPLLSTSQPRLAQHAALLSSGQEEKRVHRLPWRWAGSIFS